MAKTAAFGVLHLGIAFTVAYALTGDLAISSALILVEPLCNMVAHYFFDKYWDHPRARAWRRRWSARRPAGATRAVSPG